MIRNRSVTQLHSSFPQCISICYNQLHTWEVLFQSSQHRGIFYYHLFLFLRSLCLCRYSQCFLKAVSFSDKGGHPQISKSDDQYLKLWSSIVKIFYHHSAYSCLVYCVGNNLKVPLGVTEAFHQPVHDSPLVFTSFLQAVICTLVLLVCNG